MTNFYFRGSPAPDKKRGSRSRSKSPTQEEQKKRIPVWETRTSPNRRDTGETSHYQEKRRHQDIENDNTRPEDDRSHYSNRFEKYRNHEGNRNLEGNRNYGYRDYNQGYENRLDNRWEDKRYPSGQRRPYGNRGGQRGYGQRTENCPEGPSWQSPQDSQEDKERSDSAPKNRVKLVDY